MRDTYKTIAKETTEILFKDKGSKFYARAFPIQNPDEVSPIIDALKKKYPKANHHCYAWKIGPGENNYRANDDGEPNHSAGDPILGQINSNELSDVLVVVTRIFGGTKLGVSGLINAYKESSALAIEQATIITRTITSQVKIDFEYAQMSQVMRYIEEKGLTMALQDFTASCSITIDVPINNVEKVVKDINQMYPIKAKALED